MVKKRSLSYSLSLSSLSHNLKWFFLQVTNERVFCAPFLCRFFFLSLYVCIFSFRSKKEEEGKKWASKLSCFFFVLGFFLLAARLIFNQNLWFEERTFFWEEEKTKKKKKKWNQSAREMFGIFAVVNTERRKLLLHKLNKYSSYKLPEKRRKSWWKKKRERERERRRWQEGKKTHRRHCEGIITGPGFRWRTEMKIRWRERRERRKQQVSCCSLYHHDSYIRHTTVLNVPTIDENHTEWPVNGMNSQMEKMTEWEREKEKERGERERERKWGRTYSFRYFVWLPLRITLLFCDLAGNRGTAIRGTDRREQRKKQRKKQIERKTEESSFKSYFSPSSHTRGFSWTDSLRTTWVRYSWPLSYHFSLSLSLFLSLSLSLPFSSLSVKCPPLSWRAKTLKIHGDSQTFSHQFICKVNNWIFLLNHFSFKRSRLVRFKKCFDTF